ncbi:MAG TPA: DUF5666 domain-containing protein [Rhodothermales bacterium]|nr:DUF5666 domain-containing protein [Rhodothermales bacterium]
MWTLATRLLQRFRVVALSLLHQRKPNNDVARFLGHSTSKRSVGLTVTLGAILMQGCADPIGIGNVLRDGFTSDGVKTTLQISEEGAVFASGRVQSVSAHSFDVADATFTVTQATEILDRQGRTIDLERVEQGLPVEVDGFVQADGSFVASFAGVIGTDGAETVVICHVPPGNPARARTISVSVNARAAHLGHGDYEGECEGEENGEGDEEDEVEEEEEDEGGEGEEEGELVTICHIPPGNPANAQTIQVSVTSLPAHMAHGDHEGECTQ